MAISPVALSNVLSKTVLKSGTTVQKGAVKLSNYAMKGENFLAQCWAPRTADSGVTKLITYGKNSPMRKKGLDQVAITKLKDGNSYYSYFSAGKHIKSVGVDSSKNVFATSTEGYLTQKGTTLKEHIKPLFDVCKLLKG